MGGPPAYRPHPAARPAFHLHRRDAQDAVDQGDPGRPGAAHPRQPTGRPGPGQPGRYAQDHRRAAGFAYHRADAVPATGGYSRRHFPCTGAGARRNRGERGAHGYHRQRGCSRPDESPGRRVGQATRARAAPLPVARHRAIGGAARCPRELRRTGGAAQGQLGAGPRESLLRLRPQWLRQDHPAEPDYRR